MPQQIKPLKITTKLIELVFKHFKYAVLVELILWIIFFKLIWGLVNNAILLYTLLFSIFSIFFRRIGVYHYEQSNLKQKKISKKNLLELQSQVEKINKELYYEIASRKDIEQLLRDSEEQYRLVTNAIPVLIAYVDKDLIYRFNNKVHEVWFKRPLASITNQPVKNILPEAAYVLLEDNIKKLKEKSPLHFETSLTIAGSDEKYVSFTLIRHFKNGRIEGLFLLVSDVTPRLNYLATHDTLTDLPNRTLFSARLSQSIKRAQYHYLQFTLLFIDLDHFKQINDTLGHIVGDELLVKAAERIASSLKKTDTLTRIGGDEFTVILENITVKETQEILTKIIASFHQKFELGNKRKVYITASIGVCIYPEDGKDMHTLLKNSDMALYRAKENGRNQYQFYTEELNKKTLRITQIEDNLRIALHTNELIVYYQPILDIGKKEIWSAEALIRWQHPVLGFINPGDFIPIAENSGLIISLSERIIKEVCLQNSYWRKNLTGWSNLRTAINISARHFKEPDLIKRLKLILDETQFTGEFLTLEMTETLIMQDVEYSVKTIKAIKDLGFKIAIDDFGTGYSSLNYLRKFPIDKLKIDRSFIENITTNPQDASIVSTIIDLAHTLKMKVIAEGVENSSQYQLLVDGGCDQIQGFIFSPPLPRDEFTDLLLTKEKTEKFFDSLEEEAIAPNDL